MGSTDIEEVYNNTKKWKYGKQYFILKYIACTKKEAPATKKTVTHLNDEKQIKLYSKRNDNRNINS